MNSKRSKRNYKDTLFRMIFREPRALLSLYNAVNGTDYRNPEELHVVTLENAIYMNVKNDLAFVVDCRMSLYEQQSTVNPNLPLRDLIYVAKEYLGLEAEEREIYLDEVKDFAECGLCGTAAVISPVGKIVDHGREICLPSGMTEMGPVTKKLYDTLTGIQMGRIEAPKGWIHVIE